MAESLVTQLRRRAGGVAIDAAFRGAARAGRLHPRARPEAHGVEVKRNLRYGPLRDHRLDIYRPRGATGPQPAVLYIHGGGFRILSKDTHWVMGLGFSRAGYTVVNISYRLAPKHPYPAAVEDVAQALNWMLRHAEALGIDPGRIAFAGESAGANLALTLMVMCCFERPEAPARDVFERGFVPRAVLPYCGLHQVSDVERIKRRKPEISQFVEDRLLEVTRAYIGGVPQATPLADPLLILEREHQSARPLPPVFATVGTLDPLLDDTRRLERALESRGAPVEARYYPGEIHAFHAFAWRENAQRCWRDSYRFLEANGFLTDSSST